MLIIKYGLNEAASSHSNTGVRETLLIDDIISNVDKFLLNSGFIKRSGMVEIFIKLFKREACATGS